MTAPAVTQAELGTLWLVAAWECLKRGQIRNALTALHYGAFKTAPLPETWPNGQRLTDSEVTP